jgi:hypothetical protein
VIALPTVTAIRVIAVDWSGAKRHPEKKIWRAEFRDAAPIPPESGLNHDAIVDYLIQAKSTSTTIFVGLDFAFSYPEWFVRKLRMLIRPRVLANSKRTRREVADGLYYSVLGSSRYD